MDSQINLYGKIKDGELKLRDSSALKLWAKNLPEDSDIVVKFIQSADYKSIRQLRLFYLCLRKLSKKTGHTVEELKLYFKVKSGICYTHVIEGKELTVCKSISEFTKKELSEFIEYIDIWATQELAFPLLHNSDKEFLKSV